MKLKFFTQLSITYQRYPGRTFCAFYVVEDRTSRGYPGKSLV